MDVDMMREMIYTTGYTLELQDVPVAKPGPNEVLVQVQAAGICGSDLDGVATRSARRRPPLVMGHEFTGRVVAAGDDAGRSLIGKQVVVNPQLPCGDCIWCRSGRENVCPQRDLIGGTRAGGFAEYVPVPVRCVHATSVSLAPEVAVFAEPLATCVHGLRLIEERFVETAVVFGAGTIGLLATQLLRMAGINKLIVSEVDASRRGLASKIADVVVSPDELPAAVARLTQKRGVELALDAVGSNSTRRESVSLLQSTGTALWLGMHEQEATIPGFDLVVREQRVQGCFAYTDADFERALRLLESGQLQLKVPFRAAPLDRGVELFNALLAGEHGGFVKTLIQIDTDS